MREIITQNEKDFMVALEAVIKVRGLDGIVLEGDEDLDYIVVNVSNLFSIDIHYLRKLVLFILIKINKECSGKTIDKLIALDNIEYCLESLESVYRIYEDEVMVVLDNGVDKEKSTSDIEFIIKNKELNTILESDEDLAYIIYNVGCSLVDYDFYTLKKLVLLALIKINKNYSKEKSITYNNIDFCLEYLERDYNMNKIRVMAVI